MCLDLNLYFLALRGQGKLQSHGFSSVLEILTCHFFICCFSATLVLLLFFKHNKTSLASKFWPFVVLCFGNSLVPDIYKAYIIKLLQCFHKFCWIRVLPWPSYLRYYSLLQHFLFSHSSLIFFVVLITSIPYIFICVFVI